MAYVVNALLAAFIFIAVYRFRETLKYYIGYLFMAGSFLKFLVFFLFFYPTYTADGKIDKLEFAAFFIPYLISLVIETYFMAKMGNALNENE